MQGLRDFDRGLVESMTRWVSVVLAAQVGRTAY